MGIFRSATWLLIAGTAFDPAAVRSAPNIVCFRLSLSSFLGYPRRSRPVNE